MLIQTTRNCPFFSMFRPPYTAVCRGGTSQGMMVGLWSPCSWAPQIPLISPFFQWTNFSEVYFQMLLSSPPQLVTGFFCLFTCLPGQHDSMRCKKISWQISNLCSTTIELWSHWLAEDSVVLRCARTNLTYRNTFPTFALRRVSFLAETTERTAKIAIVFIVASSWFSPGLWWFPKFPKLQCFGQIGNEGGTQNNFDYFV